MASIERTAYPRFRCWRLVTARELAGLSPTNDELAWVRERTRTDEHLLDLVMSLKCCRRPAESHRQLVREHLGVFARPGTGPSSGR